MKKYYKPFIEEEILILEDICVPSNDDWEEDEDEGLGDNS